ncbi:MAG: DUF885 domain-containing protein [Xanthomonadales bacterium]|nr:DUF885 domain-containing protein [Xanthomonadales bacterium]
MSLRPVVRPVRHLALSGAIALLLSATASATSVAPELPSTNSFAKAVVVPDIASVPADSQRIRPLLERYQADLGSLDHFYDVPYGKTREAAYRSFYEGWQKQLSGIDAASLGLEDRIDLLLFRRELAHQLDQMDFEHGRYVEAAALIPDVDRLVALAEDRRLMQPQDAQESAALLAEVTRKIETLDADVKKRGFDAVSNKNPVVAYRAAQVIDAVRRAVTNWKDFYAGYDPDMDYWASSKDGPADKIDAALATYAGTLRDKLAGASDPEAIIGDPIGRDALVKQLVVEGIAYTPEEILDIARRELAWCHAEMTKAAKAMGYDDWHDALEKVKQDSPPPGQHPQLVRQLAWEAINYVEDNDLVTVPELAKRDWRMNMLSAERQLQAPFFLGGTDVWVAYPTAGMPEDKKRMSLRGNNRHFSRAVVHHELIPGHHLQSYMLERYQPQRQMFWTPFWGEGWALYWEFRLYEMGFAKTPEDRLGMLFWRSHRAARIQFSLGFHLGKMTPQQAIDLLVNEVGHERENAAAEVRRSFAGDYPPLYQAAYMLGGLQFHALHKEMVTNGDMTERQFHDAILQGGPIPVELVRARLKGEAPATNWKASWRFYPSIHQPGT